MRSILKCIYVILFLILIASSSALFILVACENMQNSNTILNSQIKGQEINSGENSFTENFMESESVSCNKEKTKCSNNFPTASSEDKFIESASKVGEDTVEKEPNNLEPGESIISSENSNYKEIVEDNKTNEPHLTKFNTVNDSNIHFEINNTSNNSETDVDRSQADEENLNSFTKIDEVYTEPPISEDIPPDKIKQRIIDSGGSITITSVTNELQQLSPPETLPLPDIQENKEKTQVNITEEIPVFSEWAQKQMEEAEKKLERNVANVSSMKKNATNGNKPAPNLIKLRVKNYASPDCGAKIITSNSEAQNTGALLTSSKDEYMLSPCTSRIWFVVELCEAIQAKQIDFANFELFSSSPKNFTVAVSNRFPTRDWLSVGRFIAEDTRNIQSFDLFPHLFGKYVRVDVHSHYNSEHFCPISLLRVYGTSEFEAFDSENRNPYEDIDDVDDDIVETKKKEDNNIFQSAGAAVMSIVKKAAQVLSKEKPNRIEFMDHENSNIVCSTPIFNAFDCANCSKITVDNINYLLSCKYNELMELLNVNLILSHLIRSQVCLNRFNTDISLTRKLFFHNLSKNISISSELDKIFPLKWKYSANKIDEISFHDKSDDNFNFENKFFIDEKRSYYLSLINLNYLGAMCHVLKHPNLFESNIDMSPSEFSNKDASLNLTIEKLHDKDDISLKETGEEIKIECSNEKSVENKDPISSNSEETIVLDSSNEINTNEVTHSQEETKENLIVSNESSKIDDSSIQKSDSTIDEGVNIFNIVDESTAEGDNLQTSVDASKEGYSSVEQKVNYKSEESVEINTTPVPPTITNKLKEDDSQWETDEKLFNEQLSGTNFNLNGVGTNQHKSGQHTESIFTRLSNRIKALERNMSLSGQYLEELSRRYKKQVEELQTSFSKTLTAIEEQNRRFIDLESYLQKRNAILQSDLDELNVKLHFWMFVLMIVTTIGLIYILTSFYSVTIIGRRQKTLLKKFEETSNRRKTNEKLRRRKSADGVSRNSNSNNKKIRRPSEEAMKINGSYKDLMIDDDKNVCGDSIENLNSYAAYDDYGNCSENNEYCYNKLNNIIRNRKISICYTKDDQPVVRKNFIATNNKQEQNIRDSNKFGGNKEIIDYCDDRDSNEIIPEEIIVVDDDDDDDDVSDQFISGGDSTYEYVANKNINKIDDNKEKKLNNKLLKGKKTETSVKIKRLSSPSFLKSPFTNKKTTTESTGWEWIRNGGSSSNSSSKNKNRQKQNSNNELNLNNKEYFKFTTSNSLDNDRNIFVIDRNSSPNSTISEQIILHNNCSINNSENYDSLRTTTTPTTTTTTNSESSSFQASIENPSSPSIHIPIESGRITTNNINNNHNNNKDSNGSINNGNGKNKTKKQRSFKKIFKKVF